MKSLTFSSVLLYFLLSSSLVFSQANGISILNLKSGNIIEVANLRPAAAYNPTFSNNSKQIAFDSDEGIFIASSEDGNPSLLEGAEYGNDASWSPNGNKIVFDRFGYQILVIAAEGGVPEFVAYGTDPDWNNNSKKIVYTEFGLLKTVNLDGSEATTVAEYGINPAWSPNGKLIAYSDNENLWVIEVDKDGNPTDVPQQLTFDGADIYNQQPSWSNNSKSLVFHSNRTTTNFDFDLWEINIGTGAISHLAGFAGLGDFDPSYSKNGSFIAFSTNGSENPTMSFEKATAKLSHNFPNPFTSSTSIVIEVEELGAVKILIYDQLGRLIQVLLDKELEVGTHYIDWNPTEHGSVLTSGIYMLKLVTVGGIQTKMMSYAYNQ